MATIRLTKAFSFEASHSLWHYDGLCKNIHGHSYKLLVTVAGEPINDPKNPKNGMVMDFGDLKRIVKREIVDKYDHSFIVNKKADFAPLKKLNEMFDRHIVCEHQPTCENMVVRFAEILKPLLPKHVTLHSLRLYETATSYAEWFATDNP